MAEDKESAIELIESLAHYLPDDAELTIDIPETVSWTADWAANMGCRKISSYYRMYSAGTAGPTEEKITGCLSFELG